MKKTILIIIVSAALAGFAVASFFVYAVYGKNVNMETDEKIITIYPQTSFDSLRTLLIDSNIISSANTFSIVSRLMNFHDDSNIRSGKYLIKNGWTNRQLIGILRGGYQTPIRVTFNGARKIENLAGKLSPYFLTDSVSLLRHFTSDQFLSENGIDSQALLTLFIPDTYEMYWNDTPEKIADRLVLEHEKFWQTDDRLKKAEKLNMSEEEVYTLASIVEKETNYKPERKRVAGVYLNRLERGIPLQADPTVVFAVGDFSIKRVLNKHLEYDSPYNTYMYAGLPPGPITMPSKNSIDAVLNAEQHDYLYFCAKPGYNSEHLFAKNIRQHNINARKYRNWLNREGIYQ